MFIIINILLTVLMTWFTLSIYPDIPQSGFWTVLIFIGWNILFWLFSYFYNKTAFHRTPKIIGLILFYFKELFVASLRVAADVLSPGNTMNPAIIAVPLDAQTDLEITLLANFITLTPGTLSIDVSDDRKILYVHDVYAEDIDKQTRLIKEGFEQKILNITRMKRSRKK